PRAHRAQPGGSPSGTARRAGRSCASPAGAETGLRSNRLEELDRIPGRVVDQDLSAADSRHDVIAEADAGSAQPFNGFGEIRDFDREPVPAPGFGQPAVGHGLAAATRTGPGRTESQAEVAAGEHGEGGRRVHVLVEAKLLAVEPDRGVDVIDDVAHLDRGHWTPPFQASRVNL